MATEFYAKNPHTALWKELYEEPLPTEGKMHLSPNLTDPEFPYQEIPGLKSSVQHWGQRKLFLSELEFFNEFAEENDTVVYVGAAPGIHFTLLSELFPTLNFILYDPREFEKVLYRNPRFRIFQKFFGDNDALRYKGKNYLFVSDIRTADTEKEERGMIEVRIMSDMRNQERWHLLMEPKKSLFKFRLPFLNPNNPVLAHGRTVFEYLDGDVRLQAFPRQTSAETRLIPFGKQKKQWDLKLYEDGMYSHNLLTRIEFYPYSPDVFGLDHCYDCALEVKLWQDYIKRTKINQTVEELSKRLNKILSGGKYTPLTYPTRMRQDE